jgi:hypothetical protein
MKNTIKVLACGAVAALAAIGLSRSVQAQTNLITNWGADSNDVSGVTLTEPGGGVLIASGIPTGSADWRADLPVAVSNLSAGEALTFSGTMTWTSNGYINGAGGIRFGLAEYPTNGTLSAPGGVWSVEEVNDATGYWFGPATGGNQESNPGGGDVVGKPAGLTASQWFSGNGGYGINTGPVTTNNAVPGTYNFSLSVQNVGGGVVDIGYNLTQIAGGTPYYMNAGVVQDTKTNVPLNFNVAGIFANGDPCFTNPGVTFSNLTETIGPITTAVVLGSFQGTNDPTDAGWVDWPTSNAITLVPSPGGDNQYSFVAAGVAGYPLSLEITPTNQNAWVQDLALVMNATQIASFFENSYLTFTFSVPPLNSAASGYSQIFQFFVNAPGWGFQQVPWTNAAESGYTNGDSGGLPNFYFSSGSPSSLQTQQVTIKYSDILSQITPDPGYLQLIFASQSASPAPANFYINDVELSGGPFGALSVPAPPPPPTMGVQVAKPGLRVFAGASADSIRQELATAPGADVNWVGANGGNPVKYSFTILRSGAQASYFQTHILLVPINTIINPPGQGPTNNGYADWQASNVLWLQIYGTNGSPTVTADVSWKTNSPNANPSIVALTITNSTLVGTWTLAFTSPTAGSLTAPGASPANFTISDPNASADFAGPVTAYFGVQANTASAIGGYIDYSQISITGVENNELTENFLTDTIATFNPQSINPNNLWAMNPYAATNAMFLVTSSDPYWITWSPPDTGYGLAVSPGLPTNAASGYQYSPGPFNGINSFVLPSQFNGDTPVIGNEGGTNWALIPSDCLPSYRYPTVMSAFFELMNPPPSN